MIEVSIETVGETIVKEFLTLEAAESFSIKFIAKNSNIVTSWTFVKNGEQVTPLFNADDIYSFQKLMSNKPE